MVKQEIVRKERPGLGIETISARTYRISVSGIAISNELSGLLNVIKAELKIIIFYI